MFVYTGKYIKLATHTGPLPIIMKKMLLYLFKCPVPNPNINKRVALPQKSKVWDNINVFLIECTLKFVTNNYTF